MFFAGLILTTAEDFWGGRDLAMGPGAIASIAPHLRPQPQLSTTDYKTIVYS